MVGLILSWCGLQLEWVVHMYLRRSDYVASCICGYSVGGSQLSYILCAEVGQGILAGGGLGI